MRASILAALLLVAAAAPAPPPYASRGPLPEPARFAEGVVCTGEDESHPAFSPDGRTLYFLKNTPNFDFWTIVVTRFEKGRWSEPEVAPFSGQYSDADPFITRDGSKLFFISTRPAPGKTGEDLDLWFMERTPGGWGEPRRLAEPVSSPGAEWFPTVADDGTLYFGSDRAGGHGACDLYRCRRVNGEYLAPENLGEPVCSRANEVEPYIAPDQRYLIFAASGKQGGQGAFDLFVSYHRDSTWSAPVNLGHGVNSGAWDFSPRVSPDGRYLFFTSSRGFSDAPLPARLDYRELVRKLRAPGNGLRDIYQIDLDALGLEK